VLVTVPVSVPETVFPELSEPLTEKDAARAGDAPKTAIADNRNTARCVRAIDTAMTWLPQRN
jgi:hypothetical protein